MVLISSVLIGPLVLIAISALVATLRGAGRTARGLRGGPVQRPDTEEFSGAPDLHRPRSAGRLRSSNCAAPSSPTRWSWCRATSRRRCCAATRRCWRSCPTARTSVRRPAPGASSACWPASTASARCWRWRCAAWRPSCWSRTQMEERDLASTQTRATQITGMLPFFVLMAVLYGALNAALDTTAGERERGSLEPLLMNPTAALGAGARQMGRGGERGHADRGAELPELPARAVAVAQRHAGGACSSTAGARRRCSWWCCCHLRRRCRRC